MFARFKGFKNPLHRDKPAQTTLSYKPGQTIQGPAGNPVEARCNSTITISCLKQLYNSANYTTTATNCNKMAVTGYLEQYANNMDLQQFFKRQNPSAYGSNYTLVSINGRLRSGPRR
jgi:tripeptidyl-peptidase-1